MNLLDKETKRVFKSSEELNVFEQTHYDKARQFISEINEENLDKVINDIKNSVVKHHAEFIKAIEGLETVAKYKLTSEEDIEAINKHINLIKKLTIPRMHHLIDLARKDHDNKLGKYENKQKSKESKSWRRT